LTAATKPTESPIQSAVTEKLTFGSKWSCILGAVDTKQLGHDDTEDTNVSRLVNSLPLDTVSVNSSGDF
jgi:hypothetical protein